MVVVFKSRLLQVLGVDDGDDAVEWKSGALRQMGGLRLVGARPGGVRLVGVGHEAFLVEPGIGDDNIGEVDEYDRDGSGPHAGMVEVAPGYGSGPHASMVKMAPGMRVGSSDIVVVVQIASGRMSSPRWCWWLAVLGVGAACGSPYEDFVALAGGGSSSSRTPAHHLRPRSAPRPSAWSVGTGVVFQGSVGLAGRHKKTGASSAAYEYTEAARMVRRRGAAASVGACSRCHQMGASPLGSSPSSCVRA
ncbi:unnamed protein product [Triticum turgidum subsp. durum]|uniref:Uncharacterized protein n=1 Tax=Triticum turgidum subsp. durum TaxID=4567 RepID=A0A9R1R877_TRITD|nr:unnamed protein product [Triticum turgidum subsp. durum]